MSSDSDYSYPVNKRKKFIITDSENSDESIIVQTRRKKKIYRVVSEGESSEESDVPKPVIRRQNYRVISEDESSYESNASQANKSLQIDSSDTSEWQTDWTSSDEVDRDSKKYTTKRKVLCKTKKKTVEKPLSSTQSNANIDSDNSDEQLEKCPICLLPFRKQQIGTPSVCEHCFCLECLLEWSKNINTCPVDRQVFTVIHVKNHLGGKIIKHVPVEVVPRIEEQIQEDPTFCEVCHQSDREDRMLLCDGCDCGYHLECLTPPMNEVPMEEWFCPECSQNSQNDAEVIEIDFDEISDLMEEARRLGVSYGRTHTGTTQDNGPVFARIVPRTRHTERVRANIRNRAREVRDTIVNVREQYIDPNQPSTSSGFDSIGDNSRSRSPNNGFHTYNGNTHSPCSRTNSKTKAIKKRKKSTNTPQKSSNTLIREVRITEFNDDGEEEEIVTYVKVASCASRRKCKKKTKKTRKRRKHKRQARTVSSVMASTRTVKRRLANTLGMNKPKLEVPLLVPTIRRNIPISERNTLNNARYSAGIPQISLFGNNLGLDYSPPASDSDEYSIGNGPIVNVQRRSAVSSIRRRAILKTIANPVNGIEDAGTTDILDSIISSQELWHSTKNNVILKADGTLLLNNSEKENKHSINNNESPKKEKEELTQHKELILKEAETPLDLTNVNPNNITQAPMYNNPCGGGGGNRGNFRGGYRDNGRHSHGGQSYGGRDSLPSGGRHSYGGTGPRDNFGNRDFGPPPFFNPNLEHCTTPMFSGVPPFMSRNPQRFRNERLRFPPPERPFNFTDGFERRPFPHADRFPRPRPPLGIPGPPIASAPNLDPLNVQSPHVHNSLPPNLPENISQSFQPEQNEHVNSCTVPEPVAAPTTRQDNDDCDIYCDIETPSKSDCDVQEEHHSNGSMILLPPPEPPSGLLDFEENSRSDKDNDSEQELVIDDSHKEDIPKELPPSDKYDPFAADSDSNDDANAEKTLEKPEMSQNSVDNCNIPIPTAPPVLPPSYPLSVGTTSESRELLQESIRSTTYDDEDDNDSQSDCPNFSIYSSQTMDVARHTEQELSQQLGPLQPPPLPPSIPDDDDVIVGDVQACDLPDIPEPSSNPYVEALQKERQTLSKIPPKKISHDSRGKIIFKIGNKLRLNNRLSGLHDDHSLTTQNAIHQSDISDKASRNEKQKQCHDHFTKQDLKKATPVNELQEEEEKTSKLTKCTGRSTITLHQLTKIGPRFAEEEKNTSVETVASSRKKDSLKMRRREIKECSDSSSDKETTKEGSKRAGVSLKKDSEEDSEYDVKVLSQSTSNTIENIVTGENTMSPICDKIRLSPRKLDGSELSIECISDLECSETSKVILDNSDNVLQSEVNIRDNSQESSSDDYDRSSSKLDKTDSDDKDDDKALSDNEDLNVLDQQHEKASSSYSMDDDVEQFPIEKDKLDVLPIIGTDSNWESDGAYTPCKDELPMKDEDMQIEHVTSFEVGLEPITPTKDKVNDDLDGCRTPVGYAGLDTEAISETDEAINFEEEVNTSSLRKEKEMEDGEILDESKLNAKEQEKSKEKEDDNKKKKKKDKKEKSKDTEKNKENISSDNLVAWKKISKSTKERPYRDKDKRSKSREKEKEKEKDKDKSSKKKTKEVGKKKEKRKELPRYDVRKIVAEKPSRPRKDEYGRDIREKSRSRSRSRSSDKISGSKDRRSRSYSKGRSRSRSRLRLSWSRDRKSYSKSCRSTSRRRSSSRTRRKSSRRRSMSRRRSLSRRHSVSRRRSRSLSRKRRSLSPRRRSRRSLSRSRDKRKDKTKKYKSRSRSRNRKRSRSKSSKRTSRSGEKKHNKRKIHSRSRSRSKVKSCSRDRDRNRNWDQLNEKAVDHEQQFPREREEHERSWSAQWTPSWSRSRSKTPPHIQQEPIGSRNWSPPPVLDSVSVPPKNLTVILTNKEAIKKKKKERRKESRKSKETEKRRKGKRNRTPPPSKEVFASGDNILVSVCFNKDNETNPAATSELTETIPLVPPIKRRRREPAQSEVSKRSKKEKTKDKRSKSPKVKKDKKKKSKAAEIAATKKPVAVIDLDQSPFREQTPSPRDVIVLSDDDDKQTQEVATPEQCPPSQASPPREQFVSQGPKTPPEPQIKFSINKQPSNLRPSLINPLLEEEEEEEEEIDERAEEELEMRAQEELELRLKIGPNTPPEPPTSPPTSPDAYDPFDPTKSRSPTPDASQEATPNDERDRNPRNSPRKHDAVDTPLPDEPTQQQDPPSQEKQLEKPKIISMVTIKRASPQRDASPVPENQTDIVQSCSSPPKTQPSQQNVQSTANPFATINPVLATVAAAVQRSAAFNTSTPNTAQRTLLQSNRISPSNQIKPRTNDRPQLPNIFTNSAKTTLARSSKSVQSKNSSTIGQNGSDATIDMTNDNVDMSSPYSPGSTLSDGLFDPPSPANFNNSPVANVPSAPAKNTTPKVKSTEKKDAFDALFGILPPVKTATKNRNKKVAKDKTKKSANPKVGVRMDENQLQILDDLPSSAVEMQVKDKFLKKLNRQERVVEEVKLVLKPHYTKKHVTKEEYKDIMRKAVPKICHNKTGEINPKKIAHLIEAYVRKCRNNKKKISSSSSVKIPKPAKTLWS